MAAMTINVSDSLASEFRKTTAAIKGKSKGALGSAVAEALELWIGLKKTGDARARAMELLEKGVEMGRVDFKRSDLHERRR